VTFVPQFIKFIFTRNLPAHDDGAENWAIAASLIETCKLNGIDPYTYLADVLSRLVNLWPNARVDELLPWNRAAARDHLQRAA
jgi:transposase